MQARILNSIAQPADFVVVKLDIPANETGERLPN